MFGIPERVARARTVAARATTAPLLVRCAVFLAGAFAVLVAFPEQLLAGALLPVSLLVPLWPAVAPRGRGATVAVLVVLVGWVLGTTVFGRPVDLWRVLLLASLLYLVHTLAALAAALPYDALVAAEVPVRWVLRAGAVLLGSAVVTVAVLWVVSEVAGGVHLAVTVVGLAVAVAAAATIAGLLRRG
jgi:hypothetical protein